MNIRRPWLALVLALCCFPLFVNLGRTDLFGDEAIYSFAVDRILETGNWIEPKSSPNDDWAFLEKPPLKFWIVAAPIAAGILPHNEFGIRFWDALFGALAFVYVFAIGSLLTGPVCGAVGVLILFSHWPLLFDHGLRSNNMEAPLFLCYCGGVYHFLRWGAAFAGPPGLKAWPPDVSPDLKFGPPYLSGASTHAIAFALFFVLGFMTKFVAAVFLPLVAAAAVVLVPAYRLKFFREWKLWAACVALTLGLCVPWFVWAQAKYGAFFWQTILAESVYRRFTTFLNPTHVQPWHYYVTTMWDRLGDSGTNYLVAAGMLTLVIQTIRRRSAEGLVILLWFAVPMLLISFGSSKLYHYAYPFVPPAALAAGYLAALALMLAPAPIRRTLEAAEHHASSLVPGAARTIRKPAFRKTVLAIAAIAAVVGLVSLIYGPVRLAIGRTTLFKSSGMVRPIAIVALFGTLAGVAGRTSRVVVVLLVLSALPLQGYRDAWTRLSADEHPLRAASECLTRVESQMPTSPGLYVDVPWEHVSHELNYYFRRVRPWTRVSESDHSAIARHLTDPSAVQPMLLWDTTYRNFMNVSPRPASPPLVAFPDVVLLLPGPYAVCNVSPGHIKSR